VTADTTSATNLKNPFDGSTGVIGATFPSRQDQLSNIVATGAAVNQTASSFTATTVTVAAGSYLNTFARDSSYHQLQDVAGVLDCYYQFNIGADGVPTGVTFYGRVNSSNDTLRIWGWNWSSSSWIQLGSIVGITGLTNSATTFGMFTSMVGTGADTGVVRVR
jgi:hypothetical protein